MRDSGLTHWTDEVTVKDDGADTVAHFLKPVEQSSGGDEQVKMWGGQNPTFQEEEGNHLDMIDEDQRFRWNDEKASNSLASPAQVCSNGICRPSRSYWGGRPRRSVNIRYLLALRWRTWRQSFRWTGPAGYRWAYRWRRIQGSKQRRRLSMLTNDEREVTSGTGTYFQTSLMLIINLKINVNLKEVKHIVPSVIVGL